MSNFDQLPCSILVTDRGGLVQTVNQGLLELVGGTHDRWFAKSMDAMFPMASRIFLQTHVWPMLLRDGQVREIRLHILDGAGKQVPVFLNCSKSTTDELERFTWVFFVSIERSRFEQELLDARHRAEIASADLSKSEKFIRTVTDAMPSMLSYWDKQMLCQFANKPYLEWFGRTPQEMKGLPMAAVLGADLYEKNLPYIKAALAGAPQEFERAIQKPDGSVGHILAHYIPDVGSNGEVQGFFALLTDVSRLREADAAIRLSASVFEATTEGIMVTDTAATIISVNPAFTALTGYSSQEAIGQNARILKSGRHDADFFADMFAQLHTSRLWAGEVWSKRKDGSMYLSRLSVSAICDETGEVSRYVGVCADITQQWEKEQRVQHLALHDGLTGLPNRLLLTERVVQLTGMAAREPRHIALMFLDLDGFKSVNDRLGHGIGDCVLKAVSTRLLGLVRPSDTVARLGGDEFVILIDNPESRDSVAMIASRVIESVNAPMDFDGIGAHVGTSIGITFFAEGIPSPDALLKSADDAMYAAKASGKNCYRFAN